MVYADKESECLLYSSEWNEEDDGKTEDDDDERGQFNSKQDAKRNKCELSSAYSPLIKGLGLPLSQVRRRLPSTTGHPRQIQKHTKPCTQSVSQVRIISYAVGTLEGHIYFPSGSQTEFSHRETRTRLLIANCT